MDPLSSLCIVNAANVTDEKKDLIGEFIRFCFTDESNRAFNIDTGCPRALSYDLTDSDIAKLSTFGKQAYKITRTESIVYPYANSNLYKQYYASGKLAVDGYHNTSNNLFSAFKYHSAETNAIEIFNASKTYLWNSGFWS